MPLPAEAYNAGALLDAMRPHVETILAECAEMFGDRMPTCPSQSHRAIHAIGLLTERANSTKLSRNPNLYRMIVRLKTFLAVHETVVILENRWREPRYNEFGILQDPSVS